MECYTDDRTLFPDGAQVEFAIDNAREKSSTKISYMETKLILTDGNGGRNVVYHNVMPFKMAELLTAIGKPPESKKFEVCSDDLIGGAGRCVVGIEEYQGQEKNRIKEFLPGSEKPNFDENGDPDRIPF